jgi:hypothetical protein
MADAAKAKFALHEGVNRVEIAVQEDDATLVVTDSGIETSKPHEIAALDEHPLVKRVEGRAPKKDKPQPQADA